VSAESFIKLLGEIEGTHTAMRLVHVFVDNAGYHHVPQPCVVRGCGPSEAHHIRFALGRKVSDEYTVPVCRLHHRDLQTYGDEASRWAAVSIDPLLIALASLELWRKSRSNLR
jgi:hypothetical protein